MTRKPKEWHDARQHNTFNVFSDLWMRWGDPLGLFPADYLDNPDTYKFRPEIDKVMAQMPAWMNSEARAEVRATQEIDHDQGGAWWANLWAKLGPGAEKDPELLMTTMAMAVIYGWPKVAKNLRDIGAPVEAIEPEVDPKTGIPVPWRHVTLNLYKDRPCSSLGLCAQAMRGNSTVTPLAPQSAKALLDLIAAGADPNEIPFRILSLAIRHEPVARALIEGGLNPYLMEGETGSKRKPSPYPLFCVLLDNDVTLAMNARKRIFQIFLDQGMPHCDANGQTLVAWMSHFTKGVRLLPMVMDHFPREPIADQVRAHQDGLRKKFAHATPQDRAAIDQKIFDTITPSAGAVSPVKKKASRL